MSTNRRLLVHHAFHGPRFDDGGLDLDVAEELGRYRELLCDIAEHLWRERHLEQIRLPAHFRDQFIVKVYRLEANCTVAPVERIGTIDRYPLFHPADRADAHRDEFDDAAELLTQTIAAAGAGQLLPPRFPKPLLTRFRDYGKSLRQDEWIEYRLQGKGESVRYDWRVGERLLQAADLPYEEEVDLLGEVIMVRVPPKPQAQLRLPSGDAVVVDFSPDHETEFTQALREHRTARVQVIGRGRRSADHRLLQVEAAQVRLLRDGTLPFDPAAKPIWEVFAGIMKDVPPEELAALPQDGAARHDHYLHGGDAAP